MKEKLMCCSMCSGSPWLVRSEKRKGKYYPFIYPCPMCNPHGDRPPVDVDRAEIERLIEERKKIILRVI